jgi:hypothetical protein
MSSACNTSQRCCSTASCCCAAANAAALTWLEASAGGALDRGGGGFARVFQAGDVAWRATRKALEDASSAPSASALPGGGDDVGEVLLRELDPDAPLRGGRMLHPADADDEARLCAALLAPPLISCSGAAAEPTRRLRSCLLCCRRLRAI